MKAQFYVCGKKVTIEASMDTLNEIAGMAICESNYCREKGYEDASKIYDDWFTGIHDSLDVKGYYDSVKDL